MTGNALNSSIRKQVKNGKMQLAYTHGEILQSDSSKRQ